MTYKEIVAQGAESFLVAAQQALGNFNFGLAIEYLAFAMERYNRIGMLQHAQACNLLTKEIIEALKNI